MRIRLGSIAILALALVAGSIPAIAGDNQKIIEGFVASVKADDSLPKDSVSAALDAVKTLAAEEDASSAAITEGLMHLYPDFKAGLEALAAEDSETAVGKLSPLAKHTNPYLSAEAIFYLARAAMQKEDYETAIPYLAHVTGDASANTVLASEARFLTGIAQSRLLQRKEATETLTKFIENSPDAPERMRVAAWRQLEYLKSFKDGTLSDVSDHMDYSRRRLALADPSEPTRVRQTKIIDMLATLIKQAEEKECNCSGSGQGEGEGEGQGQGQGEGKSAGDKGNLGKGQQSPRPDSVRRMVRGGPQSAWGKVRDKEREQVLGAIQGKFPARYQKLVEQYYDSFGEEGDQ
jgi:tetratricopeptide (TPR) repeat protein